MTGLEMKIHDIKYINFKENQLLFVGIPKQMAYSYSKFHIKEESNSFHINHKSLTRKWPTFKCPKCALRKSRVISHSGDGPHP